MTKERSWRDLTWPVAALLTLSFLLFLVGNSLQRHHHAWQGDLLITISIVVGAMTLNKVRVTKMGRRLARRAHTVD